jgi:hypothetical protein
MPFYPLEPQPGQSLERRRPLEQQAKRVIARARYSAPSTEEIAEEARAEDEYYERDPRWWYRWRWALALAGTVLWLILAFGLDVIIIRVIGGIVIGFWFLAIGTMPHMAALQLGKDLLDDD